MNNRFQLSGCPEGQSQLTEKQKEVDVLFSRLYKKREIRTCPETQIGLYVIHNPPKLPEGLYKLAIRECRKTIFGKEICHCVVLDPKKISNI